MPPSQRCPDTWRWVFTDFEPTLHDDNKGPDAEWRRGALLVVTLSESGRIVRCRLREVPVPGGPPPVDGRVEGP